VKRCPRLNSVFPTKKKHMHHFCSELTSSSKKKSNPEKEILVMFSCIPVIHYIYYMVNMLHYLHINVFWGKKLGSIFYVIFLHRSI